MVPGEGDAGRPGTWLIHMVGIPTPIWWVGVKVNPPSCEVKIHVVLIFNFLGVPGVTSPPNPPIVQTSTSEVGEYATGTAKLPPTVAHGPAHFTH